MIGTYLVFGGKKKIRKDSVFRMVVDIIGDTYTFKDVVKTEKLSQEVFKNIPDVKIVDVPKNRKSIGIAQSREAISFLQTKPYSLKGKVLVVLNSDKMTTQAQNALLKTLEEPPESATIILESKTENALLPTVVSRCKKIQLKKAKAETETFTDAENSISAVLKMDIGERLVWAEEFSKEDKETIIETLEIWIEEERKHLAGQNNAQKGRNLTAITKIKNDFENTNVNVKLGLEVLVLMLA